MRPEAGAETRIVLAGGGTGGHIFAGKAVLEALRERKTLTVLFVGTGRGLEERVLQGEQMQLERIDVRGLKGRGVRGLVEALFLIPKSLLQAGRILDRFRPHLAIGLGGYSAGPVLLQASRRGAATLLIEPNVLPGITNRWLRRRADAIAVAFEETRRHLGARCEVTGVPVRKGFFAAAGTERDPGRFRLLIFGGSQGSRRINQWMTAAAPRLTAEWPPSAGALEIVHQTGQADLAWVRDKYAAAGIGAEVRVFIDDMPREFGLADLMICRSGAGTVGELCAAGRPAVLIPFAAAADQHQLRNAETLVRQGAALLIEEREMSAELLAGRIAGLASSPQRRREMEVAARGLARPDAAQRIADLACRLLDGEAA